jgi:NADH-quinone oxidoreductase subunit H
MLALPIFLVIAVSFVVVGVYLERKVSAFIQDRLGPMEVGTYGLLQLVADLLKLLQKEDIVPKAADRRLFLLAPMVIFASVFAGYAVMPLTPDLQGSSTEVGVFYLIAIVSVDVIGIMMAGWGSNNKYSLFGAMRSVAQIVSYEIPLGLTILCAVMICQTLNLQTISFQQGIYSEETNYLFGLKALGVDVTNWGGIFSWNILRNPFLLIALHRLFYHNFGREQPRAVRLARRRIRTGWWLQYRIQWHAVCAIDAVRIRHDAARFVSGRYLFLGSWNTPLPNLGPVRLADWTSGLPGTAWGNITGVFWLFSKAMLAVLVQMWVRWTFPRVRVDQMMFLCWKVANANRFDSAIDFGRWRLLMV